MNGRLSAFFEARGHLCFCVVACLVCVVTTVVLNGHDHALFDAANKLGPTAQSLVEGKGLALCYRDGTCFHSQRMPVAPFTLAALYLLFGNASRIAPVVKSLLFLAPVLLAFTLLWKQSQNRSARASTFCIMLLAVLLPPTLDMAGNLNFEEAYFYGFLALATALLIIPVSKTTRPRLWAIGLIACLALIYLSKSAMLPVTVFLALTASWDAVKSMRRRDLSAAILCGFICVVALWGLRQHYAGGRFTLGTSLDGVNLYKGNNPAFLEHYPSFVGASQDRYEAQLFAGRVSVLDERSTNDFGRDSAIAYMQSHPAETLHADLRKAGVFFAGIERAESDAHYSPFVETAFEAGLAVSHLFVLGALIVAIWQLGAQHGDRYSAVVLLGTVIFVAAPYVAGFALVRHAMPLTLPAASYLCYVTVARNKPKQIAAAA